MFLSTSLDATLGPGALPVIIGTISVITVVFVVAPFALCCCFRWRQDRKEETTNLLKKEPEASRRKLTSRYTYYGTSSATHKPTSQPRSKSLVPGDIGSKTSRNREELAERGKKLSDIEVKTTQLDAGAAAFDGLSSQLLDKYKKK